MGRSKKTSEEDAINTAIGARLMTMREDRGWSLSDLGARLGLSAAQVHALEAGKNAFSAAMLVRTATIFGRSSLALLEAPTSDELAAQWQDIFGTLPDRDRLVLLDVAEKLASWSTTFVLRRPRRVGSDRGFLISLEGIDGNLLNEFMERLAERLRPTQKVGMGLHDYDSELWTYMFQRLKQLGHVRHKHHVFERTLLFACERLHRQETHIRPALTSDAVTIAPFFAMAASVFQQVTGVGDRRVIDMVESLLYKPNIIVLLCSDAANAHRHAVRRYPEPGEFFSSLSELDEFEHAQRLFKEGSDHFVERGFQVMTVDVYGNDDDARSKTINAAVKEIAAAVEAR